VSDSHLSHSAGPSVAWVEPVETVSKPRGSQNPEPRAARQIVVFASGSGSNFEAIVEQLQGKIEVALLVCDQPGAYCLERAERLGVPTLVLSPKDFENKTAYETEIVQSLNKINPDLIVLAGYMRIIGPTLLAAYEGKIINIHPALLPAFPGKDGIGDALKYGVKVLGITVHYVDEGIDTGKIIDQGALHIDPNDTEEQTRTKIHNLEHQLYPKVIMDLLNLDSQ